MNSALSTLFSSPFGLTASPFISAPKALTFPPPSSNANPLAAPRLRLSSSPDNKFIKACSSSAPAAPSLKNPVLRSLENSAAAAVLLAATISFAGKPLTARAEQLPPPVALSEQQALEEEQQQAPESSPLPEFLESNPDSVEKLKQLLQSKLENREDQEAIAILNRLVSAQPAETEWKFLLARVLNETGDTKRAREVFEEILKTNPLYFEALFENALLMDRCGEGEAVLSRLEEALSMAEGEKKAKEARDVKLIMAQMRFLQKDVDGALSSYQELVKEDPVDFRPYFCQGMIYSLLDRNEEAREQFAKYRDLSPRKFEVDGYLRTPLSRMKLFGTDESN